MNDHYVVDADSINKQKLRDLGYTIYHRPHFSLVEGVHTRKKWTLCPSQKTGTDAAEVSAEAMSFDEYYKTFDAIKEIVSTHYNISISDIESGPRSRINSEARRVAVYLMYLYSNIGIPIISTLFRNYDSRMVLGAIETITGDLQQDVQLIKIIESLTNQFRIMFNEQETKYSFKSKECLQNGG